MGKSIKKIVKKGKKVLRDDGLVVFTRRVVNWTIFHVKNRKHEMVVKDILFINGCGLEHPARYRVDHQIEQLEANGFTVDKIFYTNLNPNVLKYYRSVIIFRCPIIDSIEELIEKARFFNKKVFYDIDDLVIDREYTDKIEYVQGMNEKDRKIYDDGVIKMGETMKKCDYCITTTPALARELSKYGKEIFINKNVASEEMVKLSLDAVKKLKKDDSKIRIGYLSGSITHNPDFKLIEQALIRILDEFPNTELCVQGYLDVSSKLTRYKDRIIKKGFVSWRKLPEIIAELDINLAPIEETVFNEAKSENKWTEAALCRVVTVASDYGAFKDVVEDGKTGMLCKNENEWYEKIKELIVDKDLRKRMGDNAYKKVMKEYITTYSGGGLAKFIESKLARNIAFVLPSTNISGGVNVVLKHCEILRRNGWDAMVINMDASDEDIVNESGEVNVVSGIKHDIIAKFDTMVATLFTTLKYVKAYPNVKNKLYLVQNFETDFNEYGSPARREANATYVGNEDIKYITISKWCKDWLKKDYGKEAKYAPNGIDVDKFKRKKRDFKSNRVKILIEGNSDDYYKNVDESFQIVDRLDSKEYEIVYLSYQGEPKNWYKVDKFYHKIPYDKVGEIYRECDILLKTSILESFSYPPLEMMATGGYVVAVPNGGNIEYLENNKNCLFYEQGKIDEAVNKIEEITNNDELRKRFEKNIKEVVSTRDWKNIEDKVLCLYK